MGTPAVSRCLQPTPGAPPGPGPTVPAPAGRPVPSEPTCSPRRQGGFSGSGGTGGEEEEGFCFSVLSSHHSSPSSVSVSVRFRPACSALDRDGLRWVQYTKAFRPGLADGLKNAHPVECFEQIVITQKKLTLFPWQVSAIPLARQEPDKRMSTHTSAGVLAYTTVFQTGVKMVENVALFARILHKYLFTILTCTCTISHHELDVSQ